MCGKIFLSTLLIIFHYPILFCENQRHKIISYSIYKINIGYLYVADYLFSTAIWHKNDVLNLFDTLRENNCPH